jgi:alpha-1,3-glucosyltransferase
MAEGSCLVDALVERRLETAAVVLLAVAVRLAVGLHGYSGQNDPPKFGDFEAQRHWMELTLHTPIKEWYVETPDNDLSYWGIDYPPLSAYQSWVHGLLLWAVEPQAVALRTSRGYETPSSKVLMRLTALLSDVLFMFPAAILAVEAIYARERNLKTRIWGLALILLHPAFVLIDHGHFQYNCISLGLTLGAVLSIWRGREYLGSFLYVLALNHKHMSLYFALAFFAHLLGRSLRKPSWPSKLTSLGLLATTVILTFVLLWSPFLESKDLALQVLGRLVPIKRGVFEDYVANFWCVTHVLVKWKQLFEREVLVKACALATVTACVPSTIHQLIRPSRKGLLMSMLNCSLAFYLFSYQVHEKSILLACLPSALLVLESPRCSIYFAFISTFSMFPLLVKDGLTLAYGACLGIFFAIAHLGMGLITQKKKNKEEPSWVRMSFAASVCIGLGLNVLKLVLTPPPKYPFLFDFFISGFAFVHLVGFSIYWNVKQWQLGQEEDEENAQKVRKRD